MKIQAMKDINTKGFTLVELSIVLVIIGLLIGGILVAQSIITSVQITSTISQVQQFEIATDLFVSKYRSLPGDSEHFGGNGDGLLGRTPSSAPTRTDINGYGNEMPNFWYSLFLDKYDAPSFAAGAIEAPDDSNAPISKVGNTGTAIIVSAIGNGSFNADTTNKRNYYVFLSPGNISSGNLFQRGVNGNRALKPLEMLTIDRKIDDSLANAGEVVAYIINGTGTGLFDSENLSCSSGADYMVATDSFECTAAIRLGYANGELR